MLLLTYVATVNERSLVEGLKPFNRTYCVGSCSYVATDRAAKFPRQILLLGSQQPSKAQRLVFVIVNVCTSSRGPCSQQPTHSSRSFCKLSLNLAPEPHPSPPPNPQPVARARQPLVARWGQRLHQQRLAPDGLSAPWPGALDAVIGAPAAHADTFGGRVSAITAVTVMARWLSTLPVRMHERAHTHAHLAVLD